MRRGITITRRGAAWTALGVLLAGLGALAGYCWDTSRVSGPEGVGAVVLIAAAAVVTAWLRRDKLHHPGKHRQVRQ